MSHTADAGVIVGATAVAALVMFAVFLGSTRLFAPFAGVAITKASFGIGPRLFSLPFGLGRLEIRLLPLNVWVQFAGANPYVEDPPPPPPLVPWSEASTLRRVLAFFVAPRVVSLALVLVSLGLARGWTAFVSAQADAFAAFTGQAPALFDRAAATLATEGFAVLAAVTLAKLVAMNLWLVPNELLMLAGAAHARTTAPIRALVMLLTLAFVIPWAIAFVRWVIA